MGYYMDQQDSSFHIDAANVPYAHKALLTERPNGGWIMFNDLVESKDFSAAMSACRYDVDTDSKGNIVGICFTGEKLGQDEEIMQTIAPYVKRGSYIEMKGEDGYLWRWNFDGKTCREIYAEIHWPDFIDGED